MADELKSGMAYAAEAAVHAFLPQLGKRGVYFTVHTGNASTVVVCGPGGDLVCKFSWYSSGVDVLADGPNGLEAIRFESYGEFEAWVKSTCFRLGYL